MNPDKIKEMIVGFSEASSFLRDNVVQARLNDAGRYEVKLEPGHANAENKIELDPAAVPKDPSAKTTTCSPCKCC